MKKLVTAILVLAMCATMSVTAFAASGNDKGLGLGDKDIDVNAKYSDSVTTPTVYSVDVAWGVMEFTYSAAGTKDWDASNHTYKNNTTAGWSASGNTVTVTNHSNAAVSAEFTFAKNSTLTDSITGAFTYNKTVSGNTAVLAAGVENQPNAADSVVATLTLSGVLGSDKTALTKVGAITVSLS